MSIEPAAKELAAELTRHDFIEIRCHHDADGIAAGSIMSLALYRAHIPFRLRITHRIKASDLPKAHVLLCDLGSGIHDLPEETMVIDHHLPVFEGPYHVNPRLAGIDGENELSAAGAAYIVANMIGDNRDLAGLTLLGIIGDGQQLTGKNQEIYLEAMGNGILTKKRGMRIPGRSLKERVFLSTMPFMAGYSGDEEAVSSLFNKDNQDQVADPDLNNSILTLEAARFCRPEAIMNIWGDVYELNREIVEDAHALTLLVDACGKEGESGLAASLCMRSSTGLQRAWEIAADHRLNLIREIKTFLSQPSDGQVRRYETGDRHLASDIADIISRTLEGEGPVIITTPAEDGSTRLSIRAKTSGHEGLGAIVRTIAEECGGYGGGHRERAGATVASDQLDTFITQLTGVCIA